MSAITGRRRKFSTISTLPVFPAAIPGSGSRPSVDGATGALYKGATGGGRNPAAAVL